MESSFARGRHRRKRNSGPGVLPVRSHHRLSGTLDQVDPLIIFTNISLQEAYTLTALDKRCFAPPIEDHWGRFVNMANTCESFKISARTVADLNNSGFKSVTLLSMARPRNLSSDTNDLASFRKCLRTLNDRRVTVLEPLHSLRRLAQAKRKHFHTISKWEYLDLAGLCPSKLPPNRDYKVIYFFYFFASIFNLEKDKGP